MAFAAFELAAQSIYHKKGVNELPVVICEAVPVLKRGLLVITLVVFNLLLRKRIRLG